MATTIGEIQLLATVDTSRYKRGADEIDRTNAQIARSGEKASSGLNTGFNRVAKVGMAAVAAAAVAVGAIIVTNIGAAVRRVDTLNNASRTFANMGFSTKVVTKSMKALEESITGLPTPLDSAVRGMQSLAATYGNVSLGQKVFTALNNAIIGFGGSAEEVDNAIQQLSQLPMSGPLDAQTWNSLRQSGLTPVLVAMSKDMGISINKMKEKFGEGKLTVKDFTTALIDMNKDGGGGMKSLEKIVRDATGGIGTSWANMQTAITRGLANIIKAVGTEKVAKALTDIGKAFEKALTFVAQLFTKLAGSEIVIYTVAGLLGGVLVAALVLATSAVVAFLAPMLPLIAAFAALGAIGYLIKTNFEKLKPILDPIVAVFKDMWATLQPFREFVAGQFISAWNDLRSSFMQLKTTLEPFLPQLKTLAIIIGGVVLAAFLAVIVIIAAVITVVARLIGWIAKASAWFTQLQVNIGRAIKQAYYIVKDGIGLMIFAIRTLPSAIKAALGNLGNLLYNAGRSIITGLRRGITDAIGGVMDTIRNLAGRVSGAFKSVLGIHSPSKVFEGFGENITQGLINGIGNGKHMIDSAVAGLSAATIAPAVNLEGAMVGNGGGSNVTVQIDMSGIMTRSKSDEREIAKGLIETVNEELRSKQLPEIGGGALRGVNR